MDVVALQKKIKLIEIRTRHLTKDLFSGAYQSSFKGRGMTFSEVRDYHIGDEVRTIDWNVTARFNAPFVKVFEEERELTVVLVIDVSASMNFGTTEKTKKDLAIEVAAVLLFSAVANGDMVGAVFVSDHVEKFIPPGGGKKHALLILREMIEFKPKSTKTNLNSGLRFMRNVLKKRSVCFLLSDLMDVNSLKEELKIVRRKHDFTTIRLVDTAEQILADLGVIQLKNAENGELSWVNTASPEVQKAHSERFQTFENDLKSLFLKMGTDLVSIQTSEDYILKLIQLFRSKK